MKKALAIGVLILLSFVGCGTKNSFGYGYRTNDFKMQGWMKVDPYTRGDTSAFDRVSYEKRSSDLIDYFIGEHGMPDYYFTQDVYEVKYGYLKTGKIYSFRLGVSKDRLIGETTYRAYKDEMPYGVVKEFEAYGKGKFRGKKRVASSKKRVRPTSTRSKKAQKYLAYPKKCEYINGLSGDNFKKSDVNCLVKVTTARENQRSPYAIDNLVTMNEAFPNGNTIIYDLTIKGLENLHRANQKERAKFKELIKDTKKEKIKEICENRGSRLLVSKGVNFHFKYKDKYKKKIFDILISKKACQGY